MTNGDPARRNRSRLFLLIASMVIVASACASTADDVESIDDPAADSAAQTIAEDGDDQSAAPSVRSIPNQGGVLEGHTPRGFNGSGVGLFAGDELNPNFPPDDGVQIWLTFELPADLPPIDSAIVRSDALTVRGNPFETLGALEIAPVQFDAFGPAVVDLEPTGDTVTCPAPDGSSFECDVTAAVQLAVEDGADRAQFRLRFEKASDPDGEQDLALFFLSDSNTNEPGIFELSIG